MKPTQKTNQGDSQNMVERDIVTTLRGRKQRRYAIDVEIRDTMDETAKRQKMSLAIHVEEKDIWLKCANQKLKKCEFCHKKRE